MKRPTHYQIVERSIYLADGMAPKCALKAICAIIEFLGANCGKLPYQRALARSQNIHLRTLQRGLDWLVNNGQLAIKNSRYIVPCMITIPAEMMTETIIKSDALVTHKRRTNDALVTHKRRTSDALVTHLQNGYTLYTKNIKNYIKKATFHFALEGSADAELTHTNAAFGLAENKLSLAVGMSLDEEPIYAENQVLASSQNSEPSKAPINSLKFSSVERNPNPPLKASSKPSQISRLSDDNLINDKIQASPPSEPVSEEPASKKQQYVAKPKDVEMVTAYVLDFLTKQIKSKNVRHNRYKASNKSDLSAISEDFFDYYESCGWRVGSKPMKNWRSAMNRWLITTKDTNPISSKNAN